MGAGRRGSVMTDEQRAEALGVLLAAKRRELGRIDAIKRMVALGVAPTVAAALMQLTLDRDGEDQP
mgnify:CR=1 FL=1